jgi:hypothetical protein
MNTEWMLIILTLCFATWAFVFMRLWIDAKTELEKYKCMYQYRLNKYIDLMLERKQKEGK